MTISLIGVSLPTFLIGILLILFFAVTLKWLPSFGRGEVVAFGPWTTGITSVDGWRHLVLPAITLAVFQLTLIMRLVRSEMLEVLRTDYIKFARARGLPDRAVYFGHALKNTLVPVMTITGLQLGGLIAFAIITETVFQWPGMGLLFIQAVQFADIPVMAAYLCLIALIFVIINLVVDLLYFAVDPRLRVERTAARALTRFLTQFLNRTHPEPDMKRIAPLARRRLARARGADVASRDPARRQPGRRAVDGPALAERELQLSFTATSTSRWSSASKTWAWCPRSPPSGRRRARRSGASTCARTSNSTTARRSRPTTSSSRSSARPATAPT